MQVPATDQVVVACDGFCFALQNAPKKARGMASKTKALVSILIPDLGGIWGIGGRIKSYEVPRARRARAKPHQSGHRPAAL